MATNASLLDTGDKESNPLTRHLTEALAPDLQVLRQIGEGRTGIVYLASEPALDRRVALKAMRPSLSRDATMVERFKREARAMAGCPHPNIVAVHKVGETEAGVPYLSMEYIEGETLRDRLRRKGHLPLREAVRIVTHLANALTRAHELGLVHRDVKPEDVLIEEGTGRILITDFGLAKLVSKGQRLATLTGQGEVLGTPQYTSPEQAEAGNASPKSDQYSLAVMAYEMLSGRLPFQGPNAQDYLQQHAEATPPFLLQVEPGIRPEIARVIDRGLMKEPGARFSSADAFAEALNGAARGAEAEAEDRGSSNEWWRYQRLVIQGLAIYAGAAWGILEALTWILETFDVSADLRRPALWFVLALFPIVLVALFAYSRSQTLGRDQA